MRDTASSAEAQDTPGSGRAEDIANPRHIAATPLRIDGSGTILVLAAASLAEVLPEAAEAWSRQGEPVGTGPELARGLREAVISFGATSRLARQAELNPAAAVFVGADREWLRWLEGRGRILAPSVRRIAGNSLIAVVPRGAAVVPASPQELPRVERIALAGDNVPAGRYARSALSGEGVWPAVADKVVSANSVRSALQWAARGEVDLAVVYKTDARAHPGVSEAFTFSYSSHQPIEYFAAPLRGAPTEALEFVKFLTTEASRELFTRHGFSLYDADSLYDGGLYDGAPGRGATAEPPDAGTRPALWAAIRISVVVALLATVLASPAAIALGWIFARKSFRGKMVLSTLVMAPLVMPPVITGFLLLSAFGAETPLGGFLAELGMPVPFTILGAVLAALVVGMPLYVISVRNAFEAVDSRFEELSATLGSPPERTFARVSFPLALPGIAAGALLAFARALGEFGATVVLAGNVEGSTRTIALAVYTLLESPGDYRDAWTLVVASVAVSLMALVAFEALSRRQRRRMELGERR